MISRGMTWRSMPSIVIVPDSISRIRRRIERRELLPLIWSEYMLGYVRWISLPASATTYSNLLARVDVQRNVPQCRRVRSMQN